MSLIWCGARPRAVGPRAEAVSNKKVLNSNNYLHKVHILFTSLCQGDLQYMYPYSLFNNCYHIVTIFSGCLVCRPTVLG